MSHVDFPVFDADQHYYEAPDAFIRHVPADMHKRCMQWADINGKRRLLVAGKVNKFIPNPTWDPIARPGSLDDYFRGHNTEGQDVKTMFGRLEPLSEHPEYQSREARLKVMDDQGVAAALFFPTLAVGMQASLAHDIPAAVTAFRGLNRWLLDDWGFGTDGRVYAAPVITLADVDAAVAEVEWVLDNGASIVCMVPGPVPLASGASTSPADTRFDPVWARINEAGITVGIHGGDGGMTDYINRWEPMDHVEAFRSTPFRQIATHERQIGDTFAALICHGLFARHPNVRMASIENGGSFVPNLLHEFELAHGKMPQEFAEHPVETFRKHVWISPYYEDDIERIGECIGVDHLLFGSDWPHAEGLADPTAFVYDVPFLDHAGRRAVMHDNARALVTPRSALAA